MLALIDPNTLSSNPKFNALYSDLCSNKLNADGTSQLPAKAQRDRDAVGHDLYKARVEAAKREMVILRLRELSYRPGELPEELQRLVAVVAAFLDGQIAEEDRYLLRDDVTNFQDNLEQINTALTKQFRRDAQTLALILDEEEAPPVQHLPPAISNIKDTLSASESRLTESRIKLVEEAVQLHTVYRQISERSINVLEQVIHGAAARGARAKADYLALVAEGMDKKLRLQHAQLVSQLLSPEVLAALRQRGESMRVERRSVQRKTAEVEEKLEAYGKVAGMQGLAREYADILQETEKVEADIARLKVARKL
ncbi:hypothetical protein BDY17DRAFT_313580 [Neohortaea acidophila]|uniref:HAUS augmin-like complex subunit 4-domain-containing protein n=1 Tax=Neohortaea acidophila TaxID=245834 RepID=A0A6A6PGW3_9PEZI|nr:uncharacterized protein BDY17DRAFT_313580 [Neohortaea acidophila]KAF2478971.1 hypothetical protein BDY17DRAFT_313580 [Neohortaea acidophila]